VDTPLGVRAAGAGSFVPDAFGIDAFARPVGIYKSRAQMRIVAFITEPTMVRAILDHLGEPIRPPIIAPARGPPLGDVPDAAGDGFDSQAQPAPAYQFDQRITW
jgi:hypothetical protein